VADNQATNHSYLKWYHVDNIHMNMDAEKDCLPSFLVPLARYGLVNLNNYYC